MDAKLPTRDDMLRWDDVTLLKWHAAARIELALNPGQQELKRLYDVAKDEVRNRQVAWSRERQA